MEGIFCHRLSVQRDKSYTNTNAVVAVFQCALAQDN
jgi:hypothetical protein